MSRRILYRADKRDFAPDTPIRTAGQFMDMHHDAGRLMEEALAAGKPDGKPERRDCLMLFEDEACARAHWLKMTDGKLYSVEIDDAEILHRGDMALTDSIGALLLQKQSPDDLVRQYWAGGLTGALKVEVLVRSGIVHCLIGTNEQRIKAFRKKYISHKSGPEPYEDEQNNLFRNWPKGRQNP
jgi:hypothetical protein